MTSASQSVAGAAATPFPALNATTPRPTSGEWWRQWANVDVELASVFWMTCCTLWEVTTARLTWTRWRGESLHQLCFTFACRRPFGLHERDLEFKQHTRYLFFFLFFVSDMILKPISGAATWPRRAPAAPVWEWPSWGVICMPLVARMGSPVSTL